MARLGIPILALLFLLSTSQALAVGAGSVVNDGALFNAFRTNQALSSVCSVTFKTHDGKTYTGSWPNAGACGALVGQQYSYLNNGQRWIQVQSVNAPNPVTGGRAVFDHYFDRCPQQSLPRIPYPYTCGTSNEQDYVYFKSVPSTSYDKYTTTTLPTYDSAPGFKILTFGWCGEWVNVRYADDTGVPTTTGSAPIDFGHDRDDYCRLRGGGSTDISYEKFIGATTSYTDDVLAYFGTPTTQNPAHYSLPLGVACERYGIDISLKHGSWWTTNSIQDLQASGNQHVYTHSQGSTSSGIDDLTVTLTVDSTQHLKDILIDANDGSSGLGGDLFTLYCIKPIDPDLDQTQCVAPNVWSPAVATSDPGHACCGDDANDFGLTWGGWTCDQDTSGKPVWNDEASYCRYPPGHLITGLTQAQTDAAARSTFLPGGVNAPQDCCSTRSNWGRVINQTNDQFICTLFPDNHTAWLQASVSAGVTNVTLEEGGLFTHQAVSDGTSFQLCRSLTTQRTTTTPTNTPQPAGACVVSGVNGCQAEEQQCMQWCAVALPTTADVLRASGGLYQKCTSYCADPQFNGCEDPNAPVYDCSAFAGTTCDIFTAQPQCECPSGKTWSGTQCVNYQPTCPSPYTYNSSLQSPNVCETLAAVPTTALTNHAACELLTSTVDGSTHICLNTWSGNDPNEQYYFNASPSYVNLTSIPITPLAAWQAELAKITNVCSNGALVPAYKKKSPDEQLFNFCDLNQCWYWGKQKPTNVCVVANEWVRDDLCVQSGGNATWSTRTQLLAETLYNKAAASNTPFVLHCDSDVESLNNNNLTADPSKEPIPSGANAGRDAPQINSFCVLSALDGNLIAAGTTLNGLTGTAAQEGVKATLATLRPQYFIDRLQSGEIDASNSSCNNALTADGNYYRCDANGETRGAVWYNSQVDTLVFSENGNFNPSPTLLDAFLGFWNSLWRGTPPDPAISLSGKQVYVAVRGSKAVQAHWEPTPQGSRATIIYQGGLDPTNLCAQYGVPGTDCSSLGGDWVVHLDNPSQAEWEAFTVGIRPR